MKDLKHYFASPGESDNEILNGTREIVHKKRRKTSSDLECISDNATSKKKRKLKSFNNEAVEEKPNEYNSTKPKKKRKNIVEETTVKKPRVSKLCENVNIHQKAEENKDKLIKRPKLSQESSKENSINSSFETDEKSLETSNNLHNYFNKVEKLPDLSFKANILKVEADVHYPPSEEKVKHPKGLKTRLRRRKSLDLRPEYDIITSEEDNSVTHYSINEPSIDYNSSDNKNTSDDILTSPESFKEVSLLDNSIYHKNNEESVKSPLNYELDKLSLPKVRYDGTLNSFFTVSGRIASLPPENCEERTIARQQFLNSGVPDTVRKIMENQKQESVLLQSAPFPKYRHISQADPLSLVWNLKVIKLNLANSNDCLINLPKWTTIINKLETSAMKDNDSKQLSSIQKKQIVKRLKKEISDYPIGKWYEDLLKLKIANEHEMWNEKYKPKSSVHLIGNSKNIVKLKSWLQTLNNSVKKVRKRYSSDEEFQKSDDESLLEVKNTAFLQGPPGSGKTASVYALAEEIGYKILEINSTCNRMGKKILHEFSEALQSHKVKTNVLNFCDKKKKREETKKSLILIEDVDVIFPDCDEGFISTIATLTATSKRPIIFSLNEFHPKYLSKIIPFAHFKLDYELFSEEKLSSWIRVLAAVEGFLLDKQDAFELVKWSKRDIRKLLLQLQFLFVNGSKVICTDHNLQLSKIWESIAEQRLDRVQEAKKTAILCSTLATCDLVSNALNDQLFNDEPLINQWKANMKDSSELNQPNLLTDHQTRDMLYDVIKILKENISTPWTNQTSSFRYDNHFEISKIERDVLTPSSVLNHSAVASDYLPALRSIARSEISRLSTHTKRNNRYFSYLQSIGIIDNTSKISNFLSEALNSTI